MPNAVQVLSNGAMAMPKVRLWKRESDNYISVFDSSGKSERASSSVSADMEEIFLNSRAQMPMSRGIFGVREKMLSLRSQAQGSQLIFRVLASVVSH